MRKWLVPLLLGGAVLTVVFWRSLADSPRVVTIEAHPAQLRIENARFFEETRIIRDYIHEINPDLAEPDRNLIAHLLIYSARKYDVDPYLAASLAGIESRFTRRALSDRGAMGIMQLMPETARSLGVGDPYDLAANIDGGIRYFGYLLGRYHGNKSLALAAYNAGPARVTTEIPRYTETRHHVKRVLLAYDRMQTVHSSSQTLFPLTINLNMW